ncbi:glycosyltransferase [Allomuricauda sp. NBRC 101325]|uniref:glycosyltransferase n=1 Tax=Allomuricauda sp. NBRC 101325 TaxID=1113758 RepID=UPI0025566E17|nr:glycosyltransferase [Muricauda sp. NBRC 101325]
MTTKLLVIGYVWPEPTTTAAGCRMQQLLEAFLAFGYEITFASTASKTEYSLDLSALGILETTIQLNNSSFDDFIQDLQPDVVLFDRFMIEEQFGWRVAEFAPNALRVLNTEDLHALRKAREEAHKKNITFNLDQWKNHPMTLREVASIYRCDVSMMISTFEMEILQNGLNIPSDLLFHLPFMVDISEEPLPSFEERKGFVSIGNGKHAPNVDSIKVLKNEIWPRIRKQLPKAEIHIYGAYLPQHVNEMHDPKNGFLVKGWAENVKEVLTTSRVLLAPIQFGAGIKGKLLDAMQTGTPSITTNIGAEGMHGDQSWNGIITDDWDTFSEAAVILHQDKETWKIAQQQGIQLLQTFYNKEKYQLLLNERLQTLSKALDSHRSKNFTGKMLQHQTMASTKYMAKWIEGKHKNKF